MHLPATPATSSFRGVAPGSWQDVGQPVFGDGGPIVFETPSGPAELRRFYRILISR